MKKILIGTMLCCAVNVMHAQVPGDSARRRNAPPVTDSVRNGYKIYQGGKGHSKSQGDTVGTNRHQGMKHNNNMPKTGSDKSAK